MHGFIAIISVVVIFVTTDTANALFIGQGERSQGLFKSRRDVDQDNDLQIEDWVNSLLKKHALRHRKRSTFFDPTPRVRKEIRRLTDRERAEYFQAIKELKQDKSVLPNKWDALALFHDTHSSDMLGKTHYSANFYGWHRLFLLLAEEAIRSKSPNATIPYWDSTIDDEMKNPEMSVLWTPAFFGNGHGEVISGPCANWITEYNEPLTRDLGEDGDLMHKEDIDNVLTRSFNYEINNGTAERKYNLESFHDDLHKWVGGTVKEISTAAADPVFISHHAFIDYIWYVFRRNQIIRGVNPEEDYPKIDVFEHQPNLPMNGFEEFKNIDGYLNYWDEIVSYEDTPSCIKSDSCESRYLKCVNQVCVSETYRSVKIA